jgi:DHA1 family multidrug resistance protein-like MFS transporter
MSLDEGPYPLRIDWTAQRVFLGRRLYVWQLNLYALLAVLFVAFVGFSFSGPFLPLLVRHLGVTEPRAVALWSGVLIGLGPLSAVVASPLWGRLADRIGGRILLLRTVFGFAVLNALSAMAADVWQLAVLRLLMGALGGFTAVALTLASLSAPPERTTRAIALVQSAQILGQMVGPAFGGLMADHFGIRAAFFGSSGLAVVAGVNMLLMYQESPAYTQQRRPGRPGGTRMRFRDILWTPRFVPILGVLFVGTFTNRSYQVLIPLFVASTVASQGAVASVTGVIVAGGALAATLSANMASRLVLYFTHAQVLVVALIACACGSGLLVGSHTALQFGLLRVIIGLFDGSILTLSYGLGGSVIPVEHRASAFGVLNSGAMIGSAVSPMLGGVLAAFSLRVAFLCNAALFCCGTFVAWRWLGARREGSLPAEPTGADG